MWGGGGGGNKRTEKVPKYFVFEDAFGHGKGFIKTGWFIRIFVEI